MIRLIGIDPGSVVTGYGVIETDGRRNHHLAHGHIRIKGDDLAARLGYVFDQVSAVLEQWRPQEMAIEQVFVSRNASSALKLGQARGAAIIAGQRFGLAVSEYTPRRIKQAVVGYGGADKEQIQHMVAVLLNMRRQLQADAADALAIAICHAHSRGVPERYRAQGGAAR